MEFKDWFQQKLDEHATNATQVADAIGENQPTLQRILSGETKNPRYKLTKKIEAYFDKLEFRHHEEDNSSVMFSVKQGESSYTSHNNFPRVVGTAMMGNSGYYYDLEGGDGYLEVQAAKGSIAIRVRGDSMYPAIRDGWYVIVEPNGVPSIGEYVLVTFADGKKMVKELLQEKDDCHILLSLNGNERITAMKDEIEQFQAISAVVSPSKHKDFL